VGAWSVRKDVAAALANFDADLAAVASARGVTLFDTRPTTLYAGEAAETFFVKTLPGLGFWLRSPGRTGAQRNGRVDWIFTVVVDYVLAGGDRDRVQEQVDLAAEAIRNRIADKLRGTGTGTIELAAEDEFGAIAVVDLYDALVAAAGDVSPESPFVGGCRLEVLVRQRDTGEVIA
jgi:hypothetical protein